MRAAERGGTTWAIAVRFAKAWLMARMRSAFSKFHPVRQVLSAAKALTASLGTTTQYQ